MKVAILYICTGRYSQFFHDFFTSCEMFFLKGFEKHYFVWSDDLSIKTSTIGKLSFYYKECAGFPADSLFRFDMFLQAEQKLIDYDYIFFFNSNTLFLSEVGTEVIPDDSGLSMAVWPGVMINRNPSFYPYERNKKSLAYIPPRQKDYKYFMGGLNGGCSRDYLKMIKTLAENIRIDYNKGIIARAHDESHINAYMRSHKCKIISQEYCWPEEWRPIGFKPKIVFRSKTRIDPFYNRGRNSFLLWKLKKGINLLYNAIKWYL